MKYEYSKDPKTFDTVSGTLWKCGNIMIDYRNGYRIGWTLWIALCDDHPWWCPQWLMERIKKHILKIHTRDLEVITTKLEKNDLP